LLKAEMRMAEMRMAEMRMAEMGMAKMEVRKHTICGKLTGGRAAAKREGATACCKSSRTTPLGIRFLSFWRHLAPSPVLWGQSLGWKRNRTPQEIEGY
jgi:hypothetical protein